MSAPDGDGVDRGAGAPLLRRFAEDTAAGPADLARLRAQAHGRGIPARSAWGLAAGLGGLALAAALALALLRPAPEAGAPPQPAALATAPQPLQAELGPGVHEPIPGLRLTLTGQGALEGTAAAPRIRWRSGAARVEVDPALGMDLRLSAPEGEVAVLGTIFSVDRAPVGLSVQVERGVVSVRCGGAAAETLRAGAATTCAPTTPAGMLARARALQEAGAGGAAVLAAVDQGLALGGSPAVRGELRVVAYEERLKVDDLEGALAALDAYLADGGPRQDELRAAAAGLALRLGGCARARAYLPVAGGDPALAACGR